MQSVVLCILVTADNVCLHTFLDGLLGICTVSQQDVPFPQWFRECLLVPEAHLMPVYKTLLVCKQVKTEITVLLRCSPPLEQRKSGASSVTHRF